MSTKTVMSAEEFATICEQLGACELVRGEVERLSPGGFGHSYITTNAAVLLGNWARKTRSGRVLSNEAGLIVETDPDTVRGADVAFLSYQRLPRGRQIEGFTDVAPELVVEVRGRDENWGRMLEKVGDYFRMGVDRVWLLDAGTRRLHVYRQNAEPLVPEEGDTVTDEEILPGFSCKVSEFFED